MTDRAIPETQRPREGAVKPFHNRKKISVSSSFEEKAFWTEVKTVRFWRFNTSTGISLAPRP